MVVVRIDGLLAVVEEPQQAVQIAPSHGEEPIHVSCSGRASREETGVQKSHTDLGVARRARGERRDIDDAAQPAAILHREATGQDVDGADRLGIDRAERAKEVADMKWVVYLRALEENF